MTHELTPAFRHAAEDYLHLVEKNYAKGAALKLVGDHYQLTSIQRSMLYRGIVSEREAAYRVSKKTSSVVDSRLHVDALNVLYTIANYLYGRVLFVSTDSWLRDAGEVHGKASPSTTFGALLERAIAMTIEGLAERRPREIDFYIDEPVSMSGRLAERLREALHVASISGRASTVPSADYSLKRAEDGIVATSDSTIIDAALRPVCDLAYDLIMERFSPELIDLREIVAGG